MEHLTPTERALYSEMNRRRTARKSLGDTVEVVACAIALITLGAFSIVCALIAF